MKRPLLSICVITYNHERYIRQALDSILEQKVNFTFELIIADDFSTDGTRLILEDYKKRYPDIVTLILQNRNVGPEANWLDLIAYPKSKYLLYAEGDDYFSDETKLQQQFDFLQTHPDFSMCFHPVKVVFESDPRPDEIFPTPEQRSNKKVLSFKELLAHNFIQTNSVMYRWRFADQDIRDVFPRGVAPGDWFLHLLHAKVGKIGYIDTVLAVYRRHSAGLWWEATHDIDKVWRTYGLQHLNLFAAMKQLADGKYGEIIDAHITQITQAILESDEKYKLNNLEQAIRSQPEAIRTYIVRSAANQRQAIQDLQEHANNQVTIIEHNLRELQHSQAQNAELTHELNKPLRRKILEKVKTKIKR